MKNILGTIRTRRSLLVVSTFAPMCFGILLGGAGFSNSKLPLSKSSQSPTPPSISIVNKTTTLEVAYETPPGKYLIVHIKNISSEDLNGYVIALKDQVRITTDLSMADRVIPPGQTDDMPMPPDNPPKEIIILAAMFSGGNIEGDPLTVAELREWRLGIKEELARSLPLLDEMLKAPDTPAVLDHLATRFSSGDNLNTKDSDRVVKGHLASGARDVRESLTSDIELLRERMRSDATFTQREGLLDLKRRIIKRIASL